ncbi:hypothetical protein CRYPA_1480 [uncultured Candidatus Thioglobus sp.]|nr:hypothetical protein CRYPA_1480 [uncultured Candidatus Thioglobus sp.]
MDDENNNEKMYEMGLKSRPESEEIREQSDPNSAGIEKPGTGGNAPAANVPLKTEESQS